MTRVNYTPHEEDLKAIKQFLENVSWGDKCALCTALDGSKAYLLVPERYILCPCTWEQYDNFKSIVCVRAKSHNVRPGVIITNEADEQNCERIWRDSHENSIVVQWLSVSNQLICDDLLNRTLDGIDWGRSISNAINNGANSKPVWKWDKSN